uniref:Candidate secreted effector n=1 Tax=Meloidogyne incognita TaxID=6306 RepID=A0A914LZ42_MELIC
MARCNCISNLGIINLEKKSLLTRSTIPFFCSTFGWDGRGRYGISVASFAALLAKFAWCFFPCVCAR